MRLSLAGDAVLVQPLGEIAEQRRRDGEVEGVHASSRDFELRLCPAALALRVDGDVGRRVQEPSNLVGVVLVAAAEFARSPRATIAR